MSTDDDGAPRFLAVYDGHGGYLAAQFTAQWLHVYIAEARHAAIAAAREAASDALAADLDDVTRMRIDGRVMRDACLRVDREFLALAKEEGSYAGTTATFALLDGDQVRACCVCAECGVM